MKTYDIEDEPIGTTDKDDYEKVTRITDNIFTSPKPYKTAIAVIVASFLLGLMFEGLSDLNRVIVASIFIFMIPGLLAAAIAVPIANALGGRLYLRRSMLLEVMSLGVMIALWLLLVVVRYIIARDFIMGSMNLFIIAFPFWLWHVVLEATSDRRHARTVWSSGLLPIFSIVGYNYLHPLTSGELLFFVGTIIVMLLSVIVFTSIATAPLKRNYGWDGLELVKNMLAHWTEGVTEGVMEMERFFDSFSVEAKVPIDLIAFRKTSDSCIKGIFLVPGVHAGPFGHLAGSNMPEKISSLVGKDEKRGVFVMIPHSATTHDMNPSTSNQTMKVGAIARKLLKDVEFSKEGTRSARITDGISMVSQTFGNSILLIHDPSPVTRDDLDEHIGRDITKHVAREGIKNTVFLDAHNCIERGSEIISRHTPKAEAVIEMAETAIERSKVSKREQMRMGYAADTDLTVDDHGIGPAGIQAMVIEVGGQKTAYVLIDGNNVLTGITEKVKKAMKGVVDDVILMTSDDHMANVTMGGFSPVGVKMKPSDLVDRVKSLVKKATGDLEDVEAGGASGSTQLRVFGPGATARLMATINSTMAVMKIGAIAGLTLAFTGTLVWYQILSLMKYL